MKKIQAILVLAIIPFSLWLASMIAYSKSDSNDPQCVQFSRARIEKQKECFTKATGDTNTCYQLSNNEYYELAKKFSLSNEDLDNKCSKVFDKVYQISMACEGVWLGLPYIECVLQNTANKFVHPKTIMKKIQKDKPWFCRWPNRCNSTSLCNQITNICEKSTEPLLSKWTIIKKIKKGNIVSQWCFHSGLCSIQDTWWNTSYYKIFNIDEILTQLKIDIPERRTE